MLGLPRPVMKHYLIIAGVILFFSIAGLAAWSSAGDEEVLSLPRVRPLSTPTPDSWIIMPEMSDSATQADRGAEIYRLVCRDCHGDHGQGLTDEWRAKWAPEDQNCWQSKCHVGNHPPEGFSLPRYVPPLIGEGSLRSQRTVLDLYEYIRHRMPWHTPGSLQDWEYMQLAAFLARERGLNPDLPLDESKAAELLLHP
ncbi:MAG: c-type cytochrome [Candidatus Promineifilaceae bacterium]